MWLLKLILSIRSILIIINIQLLRHISSDAVLLDPRRGNSGTRTRVHLSVSSAYKQQQVQQEDKRTRHTYRLNTTNLMMSAASGPLWYEDRSSSEDPTVLIRTCWVLNQSWCVFVSNGSNVLPQHGVLWRSSWSRTTNRAGLSQSLRHHTDCAQVHLVEVIRCVARSGDRNKQQVCGNKLETNLEFSFCLLTGDLTEDMRGCDWSCSSVRTVCVNQDNMDSKQHQNILRLYPDTRWFKTSQSQDEIICIFIYVWPRAHGAALPTELMGSWRWRFWPNTSRSWLRRDVRRSVGTLTSTDRNQMS